jgi:septal ring-binding cell division protein DamX
MCVGVILLVITAVFGWSRFDAMTVLPAFLTASSVSANIPPAKPRVAQTMSNEPSSETSPKEQPVPEKPTGAGDQGPKSPVAVADTPTRPESRGAATLIPGSEPSPSPTTLTSQKNHVQLEGYIEKVTSAPSQLTAVKSDKSLMELRREATTQWLQGVNPAYYTIQLMDADVGNNVDMDRFFQQISPASLLDKIYVCPLRRGDRDVWVVVYNEFQGVSSARRAIDVLPRELRRFQPFVRRLGDVLSGSQPVSAQN